MLSNLRGRSHLGSEPHSTPRCPRNIGASIEFEAENQIGAMDLDPTTQAVENFCKVDLLDHVG
jgi:hypothetical protein